MTPTELYDAGVVRGDWQDDPAQRAVLVELDRIHAALIVEDTPTNGFFTRFFQRTEPVPAVRGLYLWGGVGRGKTFLIDLLHDTLPPGIARRQHFHRFMRDLHAQLKAHAGESDPLARIAQAWREAGLRAFLLDEFFVIDIGDAMLLGRLMERLFAEGTTLVTTSNIPPPLLYKDGLQRASFLPAIAQIERHCTVLEIQSLVDYRLRTLTHSAVYRTPLDAEADAWLAERWQALTHAAARAGTLLIDERPIPVRAQHQGTVWFDFAALCDGPRAASDYIEIASEFHTVLVGGIPHFDGRNDDPARRFVNLIDEFYDRHVNLICTAAAAPIALYSGDKLTGTFERTASRLIEMQSAEYLAREHLA